MDDACSEAVRKMRRQRQNRADDWTGTAHLPGWLSGPMSKRFRLCAAFEAVGCHMVGSSHLPGDDLDSTVV